MSNIPFAPTFGATETISATTTSADATIITKQYNLRVCNAGTVVIFVVTGRGSATATTSDYPVMPGTAETIRMSPEHDTVAVRTASGTATVYVNPGSGGH